MAHFASVRWREQTFPGIHEPLIDTDTFEHAQALFGLCADKFRGRVGSGGHEAAMSTVPSRCSDMLAPR